MEYSQMEKNILFLHQSHQLRPFGYSIDSFYVAKEKQNGPKHEPWGTPFGENSW